MNYLHSFMILVFSLGIYGEAAGADEGKTASAKTTSRWTLHDWMEQKSRTGWMDLWLTSHQASPYEFYLSGENANYKLVQVNGSNTPISNSYSKSAFTLGAFSSVTGLVGEYSNNTVEGYNDLAGSFNLRFFGKSVQGTHLILGYGLRTRQYTNSIAPARLANQFASGNLEIDLTRQFGIEGTYKYYFPYTETVLGETHGSDLQAGIFIDYGKFRVSGYWFEAPQTSTLNQIVSTKRQSGFMARLSVFLF